MSEYYTDSAKKSLWVVTKTHNMYQKKFLEELLILTCFAASLDSGYHIGQQVHGPKLENSNWRSLEGEVLVEDVFENV